MSDHDSLTLKSLSEKVRAALPPSLAESLWLSEWLVLI
jgi:hypothetical protein